MLIDKVKAGEVVAAPKGFLDTPSDPSEEEEEGEAEEDDGEGKGEGEGEGEGEEGGEGGGFFGRFRM